MNPDKILRLAELFYSLATSEELPANSDNLTVILKNLEKLETHAARKKYAEKNLKRLSSGSSRLVYLTDDDTVVKLAKNDKGIAQNEAESNPKMKSKYLNKVLGYAKSHVWIETCYLDKINEKEFEKLTGIDFGAFGKAVDYGLKNVSESSDTKKPKNFDEIIKSDIFKELKRLGNKFKLMPGDLSRISSWGTKGGNPILIDSGLTKEVFEDFYEDKDSNSNSKSET
jgi:hypothetical protein